MTNTPPPNPHVNDIWIDEGELKRYDGTRWVPYEDVGQPDPPLGLDALAVFKEEEEEEEEAD